MSKLLSQIAIDLLPLSPEAMFDWKNNTDIRMFVQALYAEGPIPTYGSELCSEVEKEIRETARLFTKNLQEAHPTSSIYIDFYQNTSFGQVAKYIVAFKCCVHSLLEDARFYSLAHLLESQNDLECSLLLASNFYYKQATQLLRNFLEETFLPLHFCDNTTDFDAWKANMYRIPPLRGRDGLIKRLLKKKVIFEALAIRISDLYGKLSAYIHGGESTMLHRNIHLGEIHKVGFNLDTFSEWCQLFCESLDICIHLLKINSSQWHTIKSLKIKELAKVGKTLCYVCHNEEKFHRWLLPREYCHVAPDDDLLYPINTNKPIEIAFYRYTCCCCRNNITINTNDIPYTKIICFREIEHPDRKSGPIEITEYFFLIRGSEDPFCEWYAVQPEGEDYLTPLLIPCQ